MYLVSFLNFCHLYQNFCSVVHNYYFLLGRIPVRLYVWTVGEDFDDIEDAPPIDSWDKVSYINRPVEIHKEEGKLTPIEGPHM